MKNFSDLSNDYKKTLEYRSLRPDTKVQYDYHITVVSQDMNGTRLKDITPLFAKKMYDGW